MNRPHKIAQDDSGGPRLIRKSPDSEPIRYSPQRHRMVFLVLSLLIAFLLGLIIMPSNLKKNAIERLSKQHKTTITEKHTSSDYGSQKGLPTNK